MINSEREHRAELREEVRLNKIKERSQFPLAHIEQVNGKDMDDLFKALSRRQRDIFYLKGRVSTLSSLLEKDRKEICELRKYTYELEKKNERS